METRNYHQARNKQTNRKKKRGDLRDCRNHQGIMLLSTPDKVLNVVLLERMKEAVDSRRNRSCADQIASLHIMVEQSLEWNHTPTPLYINFIDYEKAFDSVDRETTLKHLRHYGAHEKIITLIRFTFQDMSCDLPTPANCLKVSR